MQITDSLVNCKEYALQFSLQWEETQCFWIITDNEFNEVKYFQPIDYYTSRHWVRIMHVETLSSLTSH